MFSFPFKNENISIENIQNAMLIFPPSSDFAKCKDIEVIQTELEILKEICKKKKKSFDFNNDIHFY
jgi:hypothetical protein